MILILGGTTEGRHAIKVCDEAAKPYFYSTKGSGQKVECAHGTHITGAMDEDRMRTFCRENGIRLLIDAAHPFAELLHQTVADVSEQSGIPVIRYERHYPDENAYVVWCQSFDEALRYLADKNIPNLLALTGVNTIEKLKPYWLSHPCRFRILDRDESRQKAAGQGFPSSQLVYYGQESDEELLRRLRPAAVITKESGESGGFEEKIAAAQRLQIPVIAVRRPPLSDEFIPVYGENGLRKMIERILPEFFPLKTGYTTGTCATAATKAALIALLSGASVEEVRLSLPGGEPIRMAIRQTDFEEDAVTCRVVKDAGDDPDVTHNHVIQSTVRLNNTHRDIVFLQGKGVGRVTLPGLGIPIGEPAINETPRNMMRHEVREVLRQYHPLSEEGKIPIGVDITVSVPEGEKLAAKTFNPKLGIVGGISIIGTSGIVRPFSTDAFIDAIRREMQVAKAVSGEHVVLNSGAKSEKTLKALYPDLPPQAFIHYGNFVGEAIRIAAELDFPRLTLGIMIGKAVKLAEGSLDTHSKRGIMNKPFLAELALSAGCPPAVQEAIREITLARQLWDIIPREHSAFFEKIAAECRRVCAPLFPDGRLSVLLVDEEGKTYESPVSV
ncbi:MAG TPA: precorrin-6x reductase [Porphyromonadaceae bacterium]|jgi:cobalt-precorrin-5B (C1)-methyltransferase|nr:precorrin-6x reductase [Porphyromonadaceae bacterium]HBX19868.1 precorrin-6x reductase [Porphyromonadaceae bacterium]